mmetsp:Transcript_31631/g.83555  ORF Transcript_31631/g.83555 Transcript_31631/m.83555 type:complete len:223 (-) Transcript_31631:254-922(-)
MASTSKDYVGLPGSEPTSPHHLQMAPTTRSSKRAIFVESFASLLRKVLVVFAAFTVGWIPLRYGRVGWGSISAPPEAAAAAALPSPPPRPYSQRIVQRNWPRFYQGPNRTVHLALRRARARLALAHSHSRPHATQDACLCARRNGRMGTKCHSHCFGYIRRWPSFWIVECLLRLVRHWRRIHRLCRYGAFIHGLLHGHSEAAARIRCRRMRVHHRLHGRHRP